MSGNPERRNPALGMLLLAIGRRSGFAHFGTDRDAFLGGLAPVLGFAIVTSSLRFLNGQYRFGLDAFCAALVLLLAPPVIADLFCFAAIITWSQWLVMALGGILVITLNMAGPGQTSAQVAAQSMLLCAIVYAIWFTWFVARHALDVSRWRAAAVAFSVVFGSLLLLGAPFTIAGLPPPSAAASHGSKG
jgi:hypothetical protein